MANRIIKQLVGKSTVLTCYVTANPSGTIYWFFNHRVKIEASNCDILANEEKKYCLRKSLTLLVWQTYQYNQARKKLTSLIHSLTRKINEFETEKHQLAHIHTWKASTNIISDYLKKGWICGCLQIHKSNSSKWPWIFRFSELDQGRTVCQKAFRLTEEINAFNFPYQKLFEVSNLVKCKSTFTWYVQWHYSSKLLVFYWVQNTFKSTVDYLPLSGREAPTQIGVAVLWCLSGALKTTPFCWAIVTSGPKRYSASPSTGARQSRELTCVTPLTQLGQAMVRCHRRNEHCKPTGKATNVCFQYAILTVKCFFRNISLKMSKRMQ